MLFDLRGRRRRAVQATYLTLAVLMGGGLVFFGIGGGVSGGLFDAIGGGGGGGGSGNDVQKRIDRNEKRVQRNPRDLAAMKELVRAEYQSATAQTQASSVGFPKEAQDELTAAGRWWQRYLNAEKGQPDPSLAAVAVQVFDVTALNRPKQAQEAAQIVAGAQDSPAYYVRVVQYATLAGDTRTADLAGQKAVDLAPAAERKTVEAQVKQAKQVKQGQTPQPQG
jgi:hypothetical protein